MTTPTPDFGETPESIRRWCDETFGACTFARTVDRAGEEFKELMEAVLNGEPTAIVEEAADVIICLARLPGMQHAIDKKMAKNRARRWRTLGDGTGYHIKD